MVTLTKEEEAKYAYLQKEGYGDLANSVRSSWIRAHETFDKLSKADVGSIYGPSITENMRGGLKRAIADGDHSLVYSIHNLFLTIEGKNERVATARTKTDTTRTVPVRLATFGVIAVMLSAVVFAVAVLFSA